MVLLVASTCVCQSKDAKSNAGPKNAGPSHVDWSAYNGGIDGAHY